MADKFSCNHEAQLREKGYEPVAKVIIYAHPDRREDEEIHAHFVSGAREPLLELKMLEFLANRLRQGYENAVKEIEEDEGEDEGHEFRESSEA